jgi:hypothetical protein
MWLLNWLPNWLFYAIGLIGVLTLLVTYFIRFLPIPFVYMYKTPLQLAAVAMIGIGTFMSGAIYDNEAWVARVKEMEEKVAKAEVETKQENVKIETKVITKTQVIKERGDDIVKYVDREVVKYDNTCIIPKEFIKVHNDATELTK